MFMAIVHSDRANSFLSVYLPEEKQSQLREDHQHNKKVRKDRHDYESKTLRKCWLLRRIKHEIHLVKINHGQWKHN